MTSSPTLDNSTMTRQGFMRYVPGLKPSLFRVVMGVGMFALTLLLHLKLATGGVEPAMDAGHVALAVAIGLLAYWLTQPIVFIIVALCPIVALVALISALWGWLA